MTSEADHGKINPYLQQYLDEHGDILDEEIKRATSANGIKWTPGVNAGSVWRGMEFMRAGGRMLANWHSSWPQAEEPPSWDVMCRVRRGKSSWERVDVWAVSQLDDLAGDCPVTGGESLHLVTTMLDYAAQAFGAPPTADWLNGYYPYASRLAVLGFLRRNKSCGRMLFVPFTDGGSPNGVPTEAEWQAQISQMQQHLGLDGGSTLERRVHRLFLPAVP